ncbi:DHH family phosphoesterase [Anaerotardibacter muris]|uniref:DHH family phosphoesterase n=1 Tax=Anaerotardibacter muris TaxID=2941505 RepID=UPI00203FFCBB|nr:bifunctional oligoribonuclease/PAP phosphatase NrnA [Anaerotardibacter muris]
MLTSLSNTTLDKIAACIKEHDRFAVCGHVNPDGDCLGSQLALVAGLRALGKQATGLLATPQPIEQKLCFLPGSDELVPAAEFTEDIEVFIAVDVPNLDRLKDAAAVHDRAPVCITIDHHASDTSMAQLNYVDPDAAAACDLIWELLKILGCIDAEQALCVLTGIMTDTGRFSYQNTDPTCLIHAAETVEAGAEPNVVAREFFQSRSLASLRLEQVVLERMMFFCDGQFVFSYLKDSDFDRIGAIRDDAEILIDVLRGIAGVRVALILKENGEGVIRGSLRAKDDTDVAQVARFFGGGGHRAAAGLTFRGSLFEACAAVPSKVFEDCFAQEAPAATQRLRELLSEQRVELDG